MLVSRRFRLGRSRMLGFLDELAATPGQAETLYFPAGLAPQEVESSLEKIPNTEAILPELARLAARSEAGAIIFWGLSRRHLVLPPFPIKEKHLSPGYDVKPLRSLLKHDFIIALVLIRLGAYAIGVCQGERLLTSKVGTGLIHARHKKGGSSQHRFERHREKQTEYFLERVCGHAQEQLKSHAAALEYLAYGGARTTILSLRKRCSFLRQFDDHTLPPLLSIPDPRQAVLEAAIGDVWSSGITEWYEPPS